MIGFHRLLIGTAIVFFLMLAVLEGIMWYAREGGMVALVLGLGSAVAAIGLTYYFFHLERFLGRTVMRQLPNNGERQ